MTTVASPVMLVDPTVTTVGTSAEMAARPETLDGLVVGLLNNAKPFADPLLYGFYRMLGERYKLAGYVYHTKVAPSRRFEPNVIDDVVERCQIAITAVGD